MAKLKLVRLMKNQKESLVLAELDINLSMHFGDKFQEESYSDWVHKPKTEQDGIKVKAVKLVCTMEAKRKRDELLLTSFGEWRGGLEREREEKRKHEEVKGR